MLGYGRSDMPLGGDVSLNVQNRIVAALLGHWGLKKPDVVAHDFGGATALRAHLIDGCDYRTLTLIDPVAVRPWGSPLIQHVRQYEAAFADMPAYMHHAILPAYIRSRCTGRSPRGAGALSRAMAERARPEGILPTGGADGHFATDEVQHRYGELRCPVQVLWGEQDQWIPIERGRELASLLPNADFIAVPDSGHLMQEDAPEAIVAAVLTFLGQLEAAS